MVLIVIAWKEIVGVANNVCLVIALIVIYLCGDSCVCICLPYDIVIILWCERYCSVCMFLSTPQSSVVSNSHVPLPLYRVQLSVCHVT